MCTGRTGIEFKKMAEFNKAHCNYSFDAIGTNIQ